MRALPEVPEREFAFSQAWDRKRLTLLLVLVPFLFLWSFGFALVLTGSNMAESFGLVRMVFVTTGFIFAVELPLLSRLSRTQRVLLFEDRLVRESGRKREPIHWEEITRVERIEDTEGRVVTLRLYTAGRKRIDLGGFEDIRDGIHRVISFYGEANDTPRPSFWVV